jgi:hypothetical protein
MSEVKRMGTNMLLKKASLLAESVGYTAITFLAAYISPLYLFHYYPDLFQVDEFAKYHNGIGFGVFIIHGLAWIRVSREKVQTADIYDVVLLWGLLLLVITVIRVAILLIFLIPDFSSLVTLLHLYLGYVLGLLSGRTYGRLLLTEK